MPTADCLLLVPPLHHLTWPSIGVHQLQACARQAGHSVDIGYANIWLAARIGANLYGALANAPDGLLMGERLFARAAFGTPPLGVRTAGFFANLDAHNGAVGPLADRYLDQLSDAAGGTWEGFEHRYERDEIERIERLAVEWVDDVAGAIADRYRVVGASTTFDQTAASVALLSAIKRRHPEVTAIIGGANCDGDMAHGVASLSDAVDHVFAGESEGSFVAFLSSGATERVCQGGMVRDMDALPTVDLGDYFDQLDEHLPAFDAPTWVVYETSRGCWWGQTRHCAFCGLNGAGMTHRAKSADRVIRDLEALTRDAPTARIALTDSILPHAFHRELVPRVPAELPGVRVFVELKSNLTLQQVRALVAAGVHMSQPGIEALATPVLRRIDKGVLARQNVATLRYGLSCGMGMKWNLLHGLPGDSPDDYRPLLQRTVDTRALPARL